MEFVKYVLVILLSVALNSYLINRDIEQSSFNLKNIETLNNATVSLSKALLMHEARLRKLEGDSRPLEETK